MQLMGLIPPDSRFVEQLQSILGINNLFTLYNVQQ